MKLKRRGFTLIELPVVRKRRGFTLIELLVVIAIIAVLATIVIMNFSNAKAKSRDARRKADLNNISKALEMYKVDHGGNLPLKANGINTDAAMHCFPLKYTGELDMSAALKLYIDSLPSDPVNSAANSGLNYGYSEANGQYSLFSQLEGETRDTTDGQTGCTGASDRGENYYDYRIPSF